MDLSNENFLMLDLNPSTSSSMDLGSLNPSLSSNITSDFSSFLESTSQNSFNVGMGSSTAIPPQSQSVQQNDMLLPADEWSGTTNTVPSAQSSRQQQGLQSSSSSQCQSSLSQGQVSQAGIPENKRAQQYAFDKRLWGASQNAHEMFGMPQPTNHDGISQGGDNQSAVGGQQQAFQTGLKKPNFSSNQSGQVLPVISQQAAFQNQAQASDMQAGFVQQQRLPQVGNASDLSSQESGSQEAKVSAQPMDFEQNQVSQVASFDGAPKLNVHMNNQNLPQPPNYQRVEVENQQSRFHGLQPTTQQAMFQRGPALNQPLKVVGGHGMQQGEIQGDPVMQTMRSLGFQMQGVNPQNALQAQLHEQYMNLSAQAGIAEVVNSMKDLISFERKTHLGPIESLARFPTVRKLQSEGLLQQSSVTQVVSQFTQTSGNPNSPYPKMTSRLPLPMGQGLTFNQASSSVLQGNDPTLSKPPSSMNQLHVQLRNQLESRNQNFLQTQAGNQMQPPSGSHIDSTSQGQSQSGNQVFSQFTPQAHSSLQGQPLSQIQSSVPGQIPSQILGCQSPNKGSQSSLIFSLQIK